MLKNIKNSRFPSEKSTVPYWIAEADSSLAKYRSSAALPEKLDVLIIGSGFTGSTIAFNLLVKYETSEKVGMIEARDICSGASGRNGGHVRSFYHHTQYKYTKKYGQKIAAEISIFEHHELEKLEKLIKEYKIPCNFETRTACQTYSETSFTHVGLRDYYAFIDNPYIPQTMKDNVKILFDEQARKVSDHENTDLCIFTPTISVWPYKLICGMLKLALEKGLNLQANTPASEIVALDDGTWLVKTPRGDLITKKLVVATNGYTGSILSEFNGKIMPVKGVVSHLKAVDPSTKPLKYNYVHGLPLENDYVSVRHDGSMVAGGGRSTYLGPPNTDKMIDTTPDDYFPEETGKYFEGFASRTYTSLADKEFINDYTWTGTMGFTEDKFPFIGDMSNFGRPGVFICAAYSGHGMPRVYSCASYVAELVLDRVPTTFVPSVFKLSVDRMSNTETEYLEDLKANHL